MAELLQHPQTMQKVQEELEQVVGIENIVEESHLFQLPYLDAVIKEALRLHPPLPLLIPHSPSTSASFPGTLSQRARGYSSMHGRCKGTPRHGGIHWSLNQRGSWKMLQVLTTKATISTFCHLGQGGGFVLAYLYLRGCCHMFWLFFYIPLIGNYLMAGQGLILRKGWQSFRRKMSHFSPFQLRDCPTYAIMIQLNEYFNHVWAYVMYFRISLIKVCFFSEIYNLETIMMINVT